jgi:hypothetical protein
MGKIIKFTGLTYCDLNPQDVLEAVKKDAEAVLVLGEDKDGEFFMASSFSDVGAIILLLETAKFKILNDEFVTLERPPNRPPSDAA